MECIREASADDALQISSIFTTSWKHTFAGILQPGFLSRMPDDAWLPTLRPWLASGLMYGLVAEVDHQILGAIIFGRGRDESHFDWWEVVSLYIHPDHTGQGIGSRLMKEATLLMEDEGYHKCYLWTLDGNRIAEQFYMKHGFRPSGERIPYRIGSSDVIDLRFIRDR